LKEEAVLNRVACAPVWSLNGPSCQIALPACILSIKSLAIAPLWGNFTRVH